MVAVNGYILAGHLQIAEVTAPVGTHELQTGKAAHDAVVETGHVHADEAHGFVVEYVANTAVRTLNRHPELVPFYFGTGVVAQLYGGVENVVDVIAANHHVDRAHADAVFEIIFGLGEGIVEVDVFGVGQVGGGGGVWLGRLLVGGGIAF